MTTPLVSVPASGPVGEPEVGGLVTVNLVDLQDTSNFVKASARLTRLAYGDAWVKLVGLELPRGYELGLTLVVPQERVIDW